MSDFRPRLEAFLNQKNEPINLIEQLTPDASTREYYRISWQAMPAIACVYPEAFNANEQTYLDVTDLFLLVGLPVAAIYDFEEALGVIIIEDFGDNILRDAMSAADSSTKEALVHTAIRLITAIQAATTMAFEIDSIASRLRFDVEKLTWELDFFKTHYFTTLEKRPLVEAEDLALTAEFLQLSIELEKRATVLCHRDFHAANLMLDPAGKMRIIDHQDARIGTASYDLVSFLLDRVTELPPSEWLNEKKEILLKERERAGLENIDRDEFEQEFALQTIQRCLKASGTFSFQAANRGKTHFIPFIKPMFAIVLDAARKLDRFPVLQQILMREI